MNNNKPFEHEIETQRNKAAEQYNEIGCELSGRERRDSPLIEQARISGVREALDWVLGDVEYPPLEK